MSLHAVLSHQSALVFYLCVGDINIRNFPNSADSKSLPSHAPRQQYVEIYREILESLPNSGNTFIDMAKHAPIQFAISSRAGVHHTQEQCSHVIANDLPEGSILWLECPHGRLSIICPELCFLLAARFADILELIYIGNLLCSQFYFSYANSLSSLVERKTVLTTPNKIQTYINSMQNTPGKSLALRAVKYLSSNALSPRECMLAMFFRLPKRLGGLGITNITLNKPMQLIDPLSTNWIQLRPDFLLHNEKNGKSLILEYNSDEHHSAQIPLFKDIRRQDTFTANGYQMLSIKTSDCYFLEQMQDIADMTYRALDMKYAVPRKNKLYKDGKSQEFMQRRLYHYLFDNLSQLKCLVPPVHKCYVKKQDRKPERKLHKQT